MMSFRVFLIGAAWAIGNTLAAQVHETGDVAGDTLSTPGLSTQDIDELTRPIVGGLLTDPSLAQPTYEGDLLEGISPNALIGNPLEQVKMPTIHWEGVPMERGGSLPSWRTGMMFGSSSQEGSMMYGYVARANMGVMQTIGRNWVVSATLDLQKNSVFYNTATVGGQVTYLANDHVSFTIFGNYSPGCFLSPIQVGQSFQWGGYVTLQSDSPWGIDLGAHTYYDSWTGHHTAPIVRPYYMLGNSKLGIDFGPLLQNAIEKQNRKNRPFDPGMMIPKPMKELPPVAPHR